MTEHPSPADGTAGRFQHQDAGHWTVIRESVPPLRLPDTERAERIPCGEPRHFCTPRCAAYPPAEGAWHQHTEAGPAHCPRCELIRQFTG